MACAKSNFDKNQTFTAHQFHEVCKIDYGTASKYLPLLVNKDLGGGRRILSTPVATRDGYVMDPPGQDSLKVARTECCHMCGCSQPEKADSSSVSWTIPVLVVAVCSVLYALS